MAKLSWKYFDDLRSLAVLKQSNSNSTSATTSTNTKLESVQTKEGSSVIEVTVLEEETTKTYRLCTLSSFIPLSWGGKPIESYYTQAKSVLMAIRDFNHGIDSVMSNLPTSSGNSLEKCNIRFVADFYDTGFASLTASRLMSKYILSKENPYETTAVLGAFRSTVSYPLSLLTSLFGIPQISHVSASTELDNRKLFGRVVVTTEGIANALVDFFLEVTGGKITHFALIHYHDEYGIDLRQSMLDAAARYGIRVKVFSIKYNKSKASTIVEKNLIKQALEGFSKSGLKYVYCGSHGWHIKTFLREAIHQKVAGPGFLWIFGESARSSSFRAMEKLDPETDNDLAVALQGVGHLYANYYDTKNSRYQRYVKEWKDSEGEEEFGQYFQSKQPYSKVAKFTSNQTFYKPGMAFKYPALLYDAVMALGIAACSIEERFFDGETLFDAFKKTKFDGVTGRIEMYDRTGTRDYRTIGYTMANMVLGPKDEEGNITFDYKVVYERPGLVADDNPRWMQVGETKFNYSDFGLDPPDPLPPLKEDQNLLGTPLKIIGMSLGLLVMALSLFFAMWTYDNRRSRVVLASQPLFLILICVGTFIMGLSFFPLSFEDTQMNQAAMDFSCMAIWWAYCFGFVLTMTALFSKTWRINKIMNQKSFRRIQVKAHDVILPGLIILTANVSVLTAWTFISPAKYERSHKYSNSFDRYDRSETSSGICVSEEGAIVSHKFFLFLLFTLNGCVVLISTYQAWKARELATEYSESRYIGFATMVLLQTLLIGAPVIIFPVNSSKGDYIVKILCFFVSSGFVLLLIFLPKLIYHVELKKRQKRLSNEKQKRVLITLKNFKAYDRLFDREVFNNQAEKEIMATDGHATSEKKGVEILFRSEREEKEKFVKFLRQTQSEGERLREESVCLKSKLLQAKESIAEEATNSSSSV